MNIGRYIRLTDKKQLITNLRLNELKDYLERHKLWNGIVIICDLDKYVESDGFHCFGFITD